MIIKDADLSRCTVNGLEGELRQTTGCESVRVGGRVVVGCVADNNPKYLSQALRLLQSLRWFGGSMDRVDFIVCIVDEADPDYRREFERLEALVRVVQPFSSRHPHSNKLRLLELPEISAYDMVILLDCDTVVVQDPMPYLDGKAFQAKIVDFPSIPHEIFQNLFQTFDLELPTQDYKTNPSGKPTVWYCNAGVLVFPKPVLSRLTSCWREFNLALLERLDFLEGYTFYCDQASLSLAFTKSQVPFRELPLSMNFPTHATSLYDLPSMLVTDPVILHYHDRVDSNGYLTSVPCPKTQKRIEQFNQRFHQERRKHFDNRLFWDFRYAHDPELGSGLGSRATVKVYKQQLLYQMLERQQPMSILDVGCGDQAVIQELPDDVYIGIDISPLIIKRNRAAYPNRRFICGDILDTDVPRSEMVICLDVLIHLSDWKHYQDTVERLVKLTDKQGLVSGYEAPPAINHKITFYHEPLSETLQHAGAHHLRKIGKYREVTVWAFEPPTTKRSSSAGEFKVQRLQNSIFIVGCMRSGTTLLGNMLGAFDGVIHCPFELKRIWSEVGGVPMASPKTRDTTCPQLFAEDVVEGQADRLAGAFLDEMAKNQTDKQHNTIFLSKNPHLCNKLPFVNALFPDTRFIWIHRHMPQVVASLKKLFEDVAHRQRTWHYWPEPQTSVTTRCWEAFHFRPPQKNTVDPARCFPGGNVRYLAEYWLESNKEIAAFFEKLPADRYFTIQEEHLVETPDILLARCLSFIGLPLTDLAIDASIKLDSTRNQLWMSRLTSTECEALLEFVEAHANTIGKVFKDDSRAQRYRDQLTSSLFTPNNEASYSKLLTAVFKVRQDLTRLSKYLIRKCRSLF